MFTERGTDLLRAGRTACGSRVHRTERLAVPDRNDPEESRRGMRWLQQLGDERGVRHLLPPTRRAELRRLRTLCVRRVREVSRVHGHEPVRNERHAARGERLRRVLADDDERGAADDVPRELQMQAVRGVPRDVSVEMISSW